MRSHGTCGIRDTQFDLLDLPSKPVDYQHLMSKCIIVSEITEKMESVTAKVLQKRATREKC